LWKKTYGELNMQETSVKQSQFAHRRQWANAGKGARAVGGTELYKQSQFALGGLEEAPSRGRKCCLGRAQACKTKPIFAPGRHNGFGIRHRMPAAPGMRPFADCRLRRPAVSAIRTASFGVLMALMMVAV
jgi:hypothetical protein